MDSRFRAHLRVISIIVLAFFLWTFGGLCEIAYAIKSSDQQSAVSQQKKAERPEEKFQQTIEDIESILIDTTIDTDNKKNKLKTKKSEVESLDAEIRKEFQETEQFLKEKGLPQEILERHYKFVKHYEDNLNELKTNLDNIEKAKDKVQVEAEVEKAKRFLEKIKPPKKHIPLDPNKLPHRTAEPVWKEPRTKPEEFLKDSSQYTVDSRQGTNYSSQQSVASRQKKPILVASNGSLAGLLDSDSTLNAASYPLYAQANIPTDDADLAETIEVQFTPEIKAKASELNYNPVKIYNWVRNNIEFVPTYGSIQGADMCLQTKQCNDFDTASLLIALLRASNIPAKYVYGTIELPIEKVKNWVGGFSDSNSALNLIASGGIPVIGLTSGGKIEAVRMEHVWAEAWIDYIPSRGSVHKQGDTWIPLDASFKQYNYTQGIDIKTTVPFDAQSFIDQIKSTATINETEGYVTNVSSTLIQQTMQDYQTQVQNYISQNYPNATVGDVIGKKEIIKQEFPYLLGTLPYKMIVKGAKYSSIPDSLRHKINFNVTKDIYDELFGAPITITKSLPELAGKKITLSYSPATSSDESVIDSYLPQPHPDGTPIQPSELPTTFPAYLINLKPELRIDGVIVATGTEIGLGQTETFSLTFTAPHMSADNVTHKIDAGEYIAVGLNIGRISEDQLLALKTKLEATKAKLEIQDIANLTKDDIVGDMLYITALSYYAKLDMMNYVLSKTMGVVSLRVPSESAFSFELNSTYIFGVPQSVKAAGYVMDVARNINIVKPLDGTNNKTGPFMIASGMNSSILENRVPEDLFSTPYGSAEGISAVKALQIANGQGIPIYVINQSNINSILPQLQVDADVKADIINAVNAGKFVRVSKTNITLNGWNGVGYIIIDPVTGAGAYMIAGGLGGGWVGCAAGGMTTCETIGLVFAIVFGGIIAGFLVALLIAAIAYFIVNFAAIMLWLAAWATVAVLVVMEYTLVVALVSILIWAWYCYAALPSPPDENTLLCFIIMAAIDTMYKAIKS